MARAIPTMTDLEIYEGFKRMVSPRKNIKTTRLVAGVLSHSHIVIFRKDNDNFIGKSSGTKKYNFEISFKKRKGAQVVSDPIDNTDANEIRNILVRLISKQDKERESFDKRKKENAKRKAKGEDELGLRIKPSIGFSVRLLENVHPDYKITNDDSNKNFQTAKKCGYFHQDFIKFAKRYGAYCFFKSS